VKEDSGQDLIEYALVGGLIVLAVVGTIDLMGDKLAALYSAMNTKLQGITIN